ncbi:hypothetical protein DPMN_073600 [Dreissena polymorpha]|uniref:SRCR domain-containing protein n=1 Tax=Dreissena polymorpha TaxID=45954 RepID=A0A9D4BZD3_DREPO|nr:hypothetical protein DPMN_073600 [Dreissena polymorpha]
MTGTCLKYEKPLTVEDIRLANGTYDEEGRVEIKVFDEWGTICDDSFGLEEATVICRMLGYGFATGFNTSVHPGKGPIFVDNLDCGENFSHINDCEYTTMHNCSHSEDVAVTCNAPVQEPDEKANASEVNKNNTATDSDQNPTNLIPTPVPEPDEKANASEVNKNNTATDSDQNPTNLIPSNVQL